MKIPIKTIGDKSGYFSYTITYEDYEIYNYILVFSIDDISVTVGGGGPTVTQSMYLDLAKIIESKILNSK